LLPAEIVDRPKGYFPLPALRSIDGDALRLAREALCSPEARARGLFRSAHVEQLLAEPQRHRGRGGASLLWQLAVLELWLQQHTASPSTRSWDARAAENGARVLTSTA